MMYRRGFTLLELLVVIAIVAILSAILFPVFMLVREKSRQAACASNERQIGLAYLQYAQEYDEVNPPAFVSKPGAFYGWDYEIQPYLTQKIKYGLPAQASILVCPDDHIKRLFGLAPRSYSTVTAYNGVTRIAGGVARENTLTPDGLGKISLGRALSEIPSPTDTILIVEWPSTDNIMGGTVCARCDRPFGKGGCSSQDQAVGHQFPCTPHAQPLHTKGWNYLFCDGHVKWLHPEETLGHVPGNAGTAVDPKGMWTIDEND